jgi:hypothetical protein
VRHDPPSLRGPLRAANRRHRLGTPGPHGASRASSRRWCRRIFLHISAEQATRILIPDRGSAVSGTARRPVPSLQGRGAAAMSYSTARWWRLRRSSR